MQTSVFGEVKFGDKLGARCIRRGHLTTVVDTWEHTNCGTTSMQVLHMLLSASHCQGLFKVFSYQADHDTTQLNNVGVGHGVQAADERVKYGDTGREDDGLRDGDTQDHRQGRT